MSDKKVLATVEGKEITEEFVMRFLNELGPQVAMQFDNPQGIKQIVDELVNQELIYLGALEDKVDEDDKFLAELERLKEGLLKQYAIGKLFEDINVDDDELKSFYDENKNSFKKAESRVASHILIDSEEKALEIIDEINGGMEFAKAATEYSTCPSRERGGNLGEFGRGQMVPEFEKAAFDLEIDELSGPVKTQHGYHLIKVSEINEESLRDFDEVKEQLRNQLINQKQQKVYLEKTGELRNKYEVELKI